MEPVGPEDAALAKVGVVGPNPIARSIFLRFLSDLSSALGSGFRRLGRLGSGWGSERPDFAQAIAPVELSGTAPENELSQLVS